MFRPSDQRRVQAELDARLPPPYEATITLADYRGTMHVTILDPDDPALTVVACQWTFDPSRKNEKQPSDEELAAVVGNLTIICDAYPEAKLANEQDLAQRLARQKANLEARAADERALKSAAAKVLAADDITPDLVDNIQTAAAALE